MLSFHSIQVYTRSIVCFDPSWWKTFVALKEIQVVESCIDTNSRYIFKDSYTVRIKSWKDTKTKRLICYARQFLPIFWRCCFDNESSKGFLNGNVQDWEEHKDDQGTIPSPKKNIIWGEVVWLRTCIHNMQSMVSVESGSRKFPVNEFEIKGILQ